MVDDVDAVMYRDASTHVRASGIEMPHSPALPPIYHIDICSLTFRSMQVFSGATVHLLFHAAGERQVVDNVTVRQW